MTVSTPRGLMQGVISSTDGVTAQVDLGGATIPATLLVHTASLGAGARVLVDRMRTQQGGSMLVVIGGFTSGTGGGTTYGPELAPNPSFEFGTAGGMPTSWTQYWSNPQPDAQNYAYWSNTAGVPHSGNGVCQVDVTTAGAADHNVSMTSTVRVDPGTTLHVGAWVKASALGSTTTVRVFTSPDTSTPEPLAAGAVSTDIANVVDAGAAWQELAGLFTVPAGHGLFRLFLTTQVAAGTALTVWWDDATVKQTS